MTVPHILTYFGKYVVRGGNEMDLNADIRQLPVVLKGAGGLGVTLASAAVQGTDWPPAAKTAAWVLALLISAATLVNIGYGIVIRHQKLRLLREGKDVKE